MYCFSTICKLTLLFSLTAVCSSVVAQIPDNQCTGTNISSGGLRLTDEAGCLPLKVTAFNTLSGNNTLQYIFDYRGGSPYSTSYKPTQDSVYTFSKTGTYMVMQLSKKDGVELRACKLVTVQDPTLPVFNVRVCSNGNITITIPKQAENNYDDFGIDWGDGKAEIISRQVVTLNHKYLDDKTKLISVQGIHKLGKCGGRSSKAITPVVTQQTATLTKLAITGPNTAELTVTNPDEIPLILFRQDGGGNFEDIGKTFKLKNETTKVVIDTNTINCFKLRPADTCVAKLESNVLCTTFIKANSEPDRNLVAITPYFMLTDAVKTSISKNNIVWKTPNKTELIFEDLDPVCGQQTCYRLQVNTFKGVVLSNISCTGPPLALCNQLGNVYIPDAFSPNGDGINDRFEMKGEIPNNYELRVYDKWGRSVFFASKITNTWNGEENGQPSPVGSYFYHLIMKDKAGLTFEKRGEFLLLR